MAGWNGSGQRGNSTPIKPKVTAKKPSPLRGLVAGAVLVAAVVGCYFAFFAKSEKPQKVVEQKKPTAIKEVKHAVVTQKVAEVKKPIDPREDYDHKMCYRDERGILRYKDGGCRVPDPTRPKLPPISSESFYVTVFSNHSDKAIADIISINPGDHIFFSVDYSGEHLEKAFLESLTTPIKINDDDSPYHKELKKAVLETRKEVARRIGDGEKLGDILNGARKELERLSKYKQDLHDEISRMVKDSNGAELNTADVKDLVAAANKMLEDNGVSPIEDDEFVRWNLRLSAVNAGTDPNEAVAEYDAAQEVAAQKEAEKEASGQDDN